MGKNLALLRRSATLRICGCGIRPVRHYSCPLRRGCSSVVEHLLAKEDVASSSLVTRSIFFQSSSGCAGLFFESKWPPGRISLPKDEYEKIASLYLFSRTAGDCGSGPTAAAAPTPAADHPVTHRVGFSARACIARGPGG